MERDTVAEVTAAGTMVAVNTAAIKLKEPLQNVVVLLVIFTKSIDKARQI